MARRVETFKVEVPPRTLPTTPLVLPTRFTEGVVRALEIIIPDGHCGLTGLRITEAKQPLLPEAKRGWITSNNEEIRWPLSAQIESGDWGVEAYNRDIYYHAFYIRFLVDEPGAAAAEPLPAAFGSGAPIEPSQIEAGEPLGGGSPAVPGEPSVPPEVPSEAEAPPPGEAPSEAEAPPPGEAPSEAEVLPPGEAEAPPPGEAEAPPPGEAVEVPEAPASLPDEAKIGFYEREAKRLEKLSAGLRRQLAAHPSSPAVVSWRYELRAYQASIRRMREIIRELRAGTYKEPHHTVHAGPRPKAPARHPAGAALPPPRHHGGGHAAPPRSAPAPKRPDARPKRHRKR